MNQTIHAKSFNKKKQQQMENPVFNWCIKQNANKVVAKYA